MEPLKPIETTRGLMVEFRAFLLRGNLVDLAVAVVIGAAFTSIIKSFTTVFITPLIGAVFGSSGLPFADWSFHLRGQTFAYGAFINDLVYFLVTCAVVFFFVVKPVGAMMRRLGYATPTDPQRQPCPQCTSEIAIAAKRCPQCTSELPENWSAAATA